MDTPMLTISEAAEKTGRSASTIRRIIKTVTDAEAHADREGILPAPKEVAAFKKKGENFTWLIREDVLLKHSGSAPRDAKKSTEAREEFARLLQKELTLKNQQIEKQLEVIHALNERLREGNILMGSLQKYLALPQAAPERKETVHASSSPVAKTETPVAASVSKEPAKAASAKAAAKTPEKAQRKGVMGWLFS